MKAVVIHSHGSYDKLTIEQRPTPAHKPDEVLLKVKAVGLNHLDIWVRKGVEGHKFPLPMIPGTDIAGVVEAAGELVRHVKAGDRVAVMPGHACGTCEHCLAGNDNLCRFYGIMGETRDGGCAEYVAVPGANLLPLPESLSFTDAAALPLVNLTAWHMLVARARIKPGETVLIHGAGSGVGSAAIQIAKLFNARVIATAGSSDKCALAVKLGADAAINYAEKDFLAEVKQLTGKRGVEVVFEHIGEATWEKSIAALCKGGRLVFCGCTSGHQLKMDGRMVFFKSLDILGSTMGSRAELVEVWKHVKAGKLRPVVDRVFPLEKIAEAHRHIEERKQFGKVVLAVS